MLFCDCKIESGGGSSSSSTSTNPSFFIITHVGEKIGEKILSSVRSARSIGLLPSASDRPEVPARAVAAAAVARALAGLPPHQRLSLPSGSEELVSIYGTKPHGQIIEDLEEEFYEEDFDPVKHVLEQIPSEGDDVSYFEKKAALRLSQLDAIAERLARHNGRRHLNSSMNEVSRDLVVNSNAKKKQALLDGRAYLTFIMMDMLPILNELLHALDMRMTLETHVEEENYFKAFQVLSEYLQVLDSFSELSAVQEMNHGVEVWLAKTLQKLDSLLLGVCQDFKEENYLTVLDAYAIIGDIAGLAEKIQSFFMQEILSESHSVLKDILQEDHSSDTVNIGRVQDYQLCRGVGASEEVEGLRVNLNGTLLRHLFQGLWRQLEGQEGQNHEGLRLAQPKANNTLMDSDSQIHSTTLDMSSTSVSSEEVVNADSASRVSTNSSLENGSISDYSNTVQSSSSTKESAAAGDDAASTSGCDSPFYQLRNDAIAFVVQTLQRGRKNLWQLTTSRVSVLLSCAAVCSTSTHQFLKNYEDINTFILAGEAFSCLQAVDFRQRLKTALKMVLEKETWHKMTDTVQVISLAGLVGDGAPLIVSGHTSVSVLHSKKLSDMVQTRSQKSGFAHWLQSGNPFFSKLTSSQKDHMSPQIQPNGVGAFFGTDGKIIDALHNDIISPRSDDRNCVNGNNSVLEDESEDLLADFIDEDSQLPSRISRPIHMKNHTSHWNSEEITAHTGSSVCLLSRIRILMTVSGLTQLDVTPTSPSANISIVSATSFGLKERCAAAETVSLIGQTFNKSKAHLQSMLLQSNAAIVEDFYVNLVDAVPDLVKHIHKTTARLLLHINGYADLIAGARWEVKELGLEHNGSRIAKAAQTEDVLLEYGVENVCETLIEGLSRVKRCTDEGRALMSLDLQVLINGLQHFVSTNVKPKLQVVEAFIKPAFVPAHMPKPKILKPLILPFQSGEQHSFISTSGSAACLFCMLNTLLITFTEAASLPEPKTDPPIKTIDLFLGVDPCFHGKQAYYLPETEYVHWARSHPEYSRSQIVGLINLVATMKSWKRKTRLEDCDSKYGFPPSSSLFLHSWWKEKSYSYILALTKLLLAMAVNNHAITSVDFRLFLLQRYIPRSWKKPILIKTNYALPTQTKWEDSQTQKPSSKHSHYLRHSSKGSHMRGESPIINSLLSSIKAFSSQGNLSSAFRAFSPLQAQAQSTSLLLHPISSLLLSCTSLKALPQGKQLHALSLFLGLHQDPLLVPKLVTFYSAFPLLFDAHSIVQNYHANNAVPWNVLISGYVRNDYFRNALSAFKQMAEVGVTPDHYTYPSVLKACGEELDLDFGKEVHRSIFANGLEWSLFVHNALVSMYVKCGAIGKARELFERMPERDVVSWNAMISGYASRGLWEEAFDLFERMRMNGSEVNCVTWNTIAGGNLQMGNYAGALELILQMRVASTGLDSAALVIGLAACARTGFIRLGKEIHGTAIRCLYDQNESVRNALITMYARCKDLRLAYLLFQTSEAQNLVTWNCMISGYAQLDQYENASFLFRKMIFSGFEPNYVTVASILPLCARVANLQHGKEMHCYMTRRQSTFENYLLIWNSLVDMYSKSGRVLDARRVFDAMEQRDGVSYTSLIAGYGMRGDGDIALKLFDEMIGRGIKPDHITMVAALSACSHSGLVAQGQVLFEKMVSLYGVIPRMEHFACMVDLLGRAGLLRKAEEVITRMPFPPSPAMWSTLIGACRIHGNTEIGEWAAGKLLDMRPRNPGYYVLIANMYAAAGRWDKLAEVRTLMRNLRLRKTPGYAWIDVGDGFCPFLVGDRSIPRARDVYVLLEGLAQHMKDAGYVASEGLVSEVETEE
ncbi:hypothetical protein ACLOJK_024646 [Asimina triloba]